MAKSKRPNRIYGRNKDQQIDRVKAAQEQLHEDRIAQAKRDGTFKGPSMFDFVSRHKLVVYGTVLLLAIGAFVVGPSLMPLQGGGSADGYRGTNAVIASWDTDELTEAQAIELQERTQTLQQFMSALVQNAFRNIQGGEFPNVDPLALSFQPLHPVDLHFLSSIANQYDMGVTTERAAEYLRELAKYSTQEEVDAAKKRTLGNSSSNEATLELLARMIASRQMAQMGGIGVPQVPSISDRWISYKLLTDLHQFEMLPVAIESDKITAQPTDEDLQELLNAGREHFADESGLTPAQGTPIGDRIFRNGGAISPPSYQYQMLALNHDAFEILAKHQIETEIAQNENLLVRFYETNIEDYPEPQETLDDVDTQADQTDDTPEGDTPEGDTPEGDTPEGDTPEGDPSEGDPSEGDPSEGDPSEGDTPEGDPSEGDTPEGDGCQSDDEPNSAEDEGSPADEPMPDATDDDPIGDTPSPEPEDLTGLDTPIPLEPNVDPASLETPDSPPPVKPMPYEEAREQVREDYIRTSLPTRVNALIDVEKSNLQQKMEAFADQTSGDNGVANYEAISRALDTESVDDDTSVVEPIIEAAQQTLAGLAEEMNTRLTMALAVEPEPAEPTEDAASDSECDDEEPATEEPATEEPATEEPAEPPVFVELASTPLISAVHGPMISGRNPGSAAFGYTGTATPESPFLGFTETGVSWHKLIRTAYKAHGQADGNATLQTLFIDHDFLTYHEDQSGEFGTTYTFVYWQVNQTLPTAFEDINLNSRDVRANLTSAWRKGEAVQAARTRADQLLKTYVDAGDQSAPFAAVLPEADAVQAFMTAPVTFLRASPTSGPRGGMQIGLQSNTINRELTAEQIAENEKTSDFSKMHSPRQVPDIYDAIAGQESGASLMFTKMEIGKQSVMVIPDSTARFFYVVRKIETIKSQDANPPAANSIDGFSNMVQYLRSGTMGSGDFSQIMNAGATDTMYRGGQQAPGTAGMISNAFMSYLRQAHGFNANFNQ